MNRIDRIAGLLIFPLLLVGLGLFVVYQLGSRGGDGSSEVIGEGLDRAPTTLDPLDREAGDGSGAEGTGAVDGSPTTTTTAATSSTPTGDEAAAATDRSGVVLPAADPAAPPQEPLGVYRDGRLVIGGSVPRPDLAAAYEERAATVLGADNVTTELTLDERVSGDTLTVEVDQEFRFPSGTTEFDPQFEPLLDLGVAALQLLPEARLEITGHTDDLGDEGTNLALSQARAQIVVNWMVERGIAPDRVIAIGAGESEPIADNATPDGREANRRIEAVLVGITPDGA